MSIKTVNLNVKELIVNEMPHLSVPAMQATVQSELMKLLENRQDVAQDMVFQQAMNLTDIQLTVNAHCSTRSVGQKLARLIYQRIQRDEQ